MTRLAIRRLLIGLIIIAAFVVRFYRVVDIPPSLSWDEVSIGYNAYSILKTGMDEHGRYFPLDTFMAYGDYKPPLPIYLTVPFVALFGLNELAVRLPSVLAGTATVGILYLLVRELFTISHERKKRSIGGFHPEAQSMALLSSAVLAISPWHIQLSRGGWEANIALLCITLGVWLFLLGSKSPVYFRYAFLPFVAAIYTFNSARYFAPFVILGLVFFLREKIRVSWKNVIIGFIVALILLVPIVPHLLSPQSRLRFAEVNIFSDSSIVETANRRIEESGNSVFARIFHNRRIGYARSFLLHFMDNLQPDFLFIHGDGNPKFSIQEYGQLHLIEAPLLVLGFFWLFRNHRNIAFFLMFYLITAIIPAATARETPHALRIENTLPVWSVMIAAGIMSLMSVRKYIRYGGIALCIGGYIFGTMYFFHNYFVHYPVKYATEWQYGYKDAVMYIEETKHLYETIVMSDGLGRPYMYALFYGAYDPKSYLATKVSEYEAIGFYNVYGFDTFEFTGDGFVPKGGRTLYVLREHEAPEGVTPLHTVVSPKGDVIFVLFTI